MYNPLVMYNPHNVYIITYSAGSRLEERINEFLINYDADIEEDIFTAIIEDVPMGLDVPANLKNYLTNGFKEEEINVE